MAKRWMGGALIALSMMAGPTAQAQYLPVGQAPPPIPEPVPCGPSCPPPPAIPGPMPPSMAPQGPCPDLDLPASLPGAFPCDDDCLCEYEGFFFGVGAQALQRERMGRSAAALFDLRNPALPRSPEALSFNDVQPELTWGVRATVGYAWCGGAVEVTGYYIPENESGASRFAGGIFNPDTNFEVPGSLASFFYNPPLGFDGNDGLWTQADTMLLFLRTRFGNLEFNYRGWTPGCAGFEAIFGVRYVNMEEKLDFVTDDNALNPNVTIPPDPRAVATYGTRVRNHIVAPQIGFEWGLPLLPGIHFGLSGKGAWGANFYNAEVVLYRGDQLRGLAVERRGTVFSHLYEGSVYLDMFLMERIRLRGGYTLMGLINVLEAVDQVNFNLANQLNDIRDDGAVMYHGPMIEIQFLF